MLYLRRLRGTSIRRMMEPGSLAALQQRYGKAHRWWMLMTLMIGQMAAIMSSTVMNVGIPDLSREFQLGQESAQWVSSSFMVAMTVSMLTTPWLLARYGYRRTYGVTMLVLMLAGITGGLAADYHLVLAMRVAEGLAAGVVQPIPAIIILRAFAREEQGKANSVFGMGVVLAPALGPSLGGVLVEALGWRSLFFMVVPFCMIALAMARRYVPTTAPGGVSANHGNPSLDLVGLVLATVATLGLLNGLVALHQGHYPVATVALLLAVGCGLTLLRWLRQRQRQSQPALLDLRLFAHPPFAMGAVVAFIYGSALFGSTYLIPVYLQLGLGLSASLVGALLLPAGLVLAVTIAVVGRFASTHPTHILVGIGLTLLCASFALMALIRIDTALVWLLALAILGRVGLGFVLPSLNIGVMRQLDRNLIPQGASVINFVRMLGGAAGVSICGIVLEWRMDAHHQTLALQPPTNARLVPFDEVFLLLAVLCALAVWAAWKIREQPSV